jgi:hypothetical protein
VLVYRSAVGSAAMALFSSCLPVCSAFGRACSSVESEDEECEEETDGGELYDLQGFDEASRAVWRRSIEVGWASVTGSMGLVAWEFDASLLEFGRRGTRGAAMRRLVEVRRRGSVVSFSTMGSVEVWWGSVVAFSMMRLTEIGGWRRHMFFLGVMGSMRSIHIRSVMEARFVCPFWRWSWRMSRGLSRFPVVRWFSMMRRLSVVRWRVSADWQRMMWEVRLSWVSVITLWGPSAVLAAMEGRMLWEMRFLDWNLREVMLETWVVKLIIKLLIIFVVASNLPV